MRTINLPDEVYEKLKTLAEPFVDTPESVIARIVHEAAMRRGAASLGGGVPLPMKELPKEQHPVAHEDLAHTRLIEATVEGREMARPKWNGLMVLMHILALKKLGSFVALEQASTARLRAGRYEEEGFKYVPEGKFSIQGVDANLAWDHALRLARVIEVPVRAVFEWREKEGAAHPGRYGVLAWAPPAEKHARTPRLARREDAKDFRKKIVEDGDASV